MNERMNDRHARDNLIPLLYQLDVRITIFTSGNVVSNAVSMIESMNNTVADTVDVGSLPMALTFNPSNDGVYVAGTLTGTDGLVSVIR